MPTVRETIAQLKARARPDHLAGMARFGITTKKRLGVAIPELRRLARQLGKNHRLALGLWKTGIPDAMILAAMVDEPEKVTAEQMDVWVKDLNSWDVCDQVCMNLFDKSPLAWKKVRQWARAKEEFVKRAAFALIACLAWHDKRAPDSAFVKLIPLIKRAARDERNYVKKAVSWALRHIGKRNRALHEVALGAARELQAADDRTARWIGADAVRDLSKENTLRRLARA